MRLLIAFLFLSTTAFAQSVNEPDSIVHINWLTFEEAVRLNAENPKKMYIDVYTDWCGWCKKMDKSTFADKEVADYINTNFYPVKLDAEQRDSVVYRGHSFKYDPSQGRRGVHELAVTLLDGKMSYPSYVYLNEQEQKLTVSPGYKTKDQILLELKFLGENHFEKMTFDEYKAKVEGQK